MALSYLPLKVILRALVRRTINEDNGVHREMESEKAVYKMLA
jgi:hypothetical protein